VLGIFWILLAFVFSEYSPSALLLPISLVLVFSGFLPITLFAPAYEIVKSRNEKDWKLVWIAALILLSFIGFGVYLIVARKDLEEK
jgi:hypothetical protein